MEAFKEVINSILEDFKRSNKLPFVILFILFFFISKVLWKIYILLFLFFIIKNAFLKITGKHLIPKKPIFMPGLVKTLLRLLDALSIHLIKKSPSLNLYTLITNLVLNYIFHSSIGFLSIYTKFLSDLSNSELIEENKSIWISLVMLKEKIPNSLYASFYEKYKFIEMK